MSQDHDVHYAFFHVLFHRWLRDPDFLARFLDAAEKDIANSILAGSWRGAAKGAIGSLDELPPPLNLTRDDFKVETLSSAGGIVVITITAPPVEGPLEAAFAVVFVDLKNPLESLRYFVCEAPADEYGPWFVGEWTGPLSRGNLGIIRDASSAGMTAFVMDHLGINEISFSQDNSASISPEKTSVDNETVNIESPQSKNPILNKEIARTAPIKDREMIPAVAGPVHFNCTWGNSPIEIASQTLTNLYRVRNSGGAVLILGTKKAKGLMKKTSSYIQFLWDDDEQLIVEIQGDYSYAGLSIQSHMWPILEGCGMSIPTGGIGNFTQAIPSSATHEQRLNRLTQVFGVFAAVIVPTGKISDSTF